MVEYLDIDLLNVLLVLPDAARYSLVYLAPIPVYLAGREVGTAVYEPGPGKQVLRLTFHEPGDYEELVYRYPACETEQVPEPTGQTFFAVTKIAYAQLHHR